MIRAFHPDDAATVVAIAKQSPEAAQWSEQSYRELEGSASLAWIAEVEGIVVGFLVARIAADQAEILNIAVAESHRRQGLAAKLLESAKLAFSKNRVTLVFLEVRESNQAAQQFYAKYGFTNSGYRKAYYHDPLEDAVLMELELTG